MGRFLKVFLIWMAIAFFIACALDVMITLGLRRTDIRKYAVWNDIYRKTIDADMVVLGSSRAWCAYNTYMLDSLLHCNSYNLGIDGHSLDMQLVRYETYRRFNPAPKVIVLNTDFLSTFNVNADPQYEREQFFPFITDRKLVERVKEEKHLSFLERNCPIVRYFGYRKEIENGMTSFFGRNDFQDGGLYKGYRGNDYSWREPKIDTVYQVTVDTCQVHLLDSFVANCQAEGTQVFFVKSPVYTPLLDCFEGVEIFDYFLGSVSNQHSIPVLDYSREPFCRDRSFFYDAGHLNTRGSVTFTRMLCEDLVNDFADIVTCLEE